MERKKPRKRSSRATRKLKISSAKSGQEKAPKKRFLKSQSAEQEAPPLNAKIPLQMERKKAPKKEVAKPRTNKNNGL